MFMDDCNIWFDMMDGVLKAAEISLSGLLKTKAAVVGVHVYV